jgi:hypothetical protein
MKLTSWILSFFFALLATSALAADERAFGLGVIAGEPTGITGKYMLNDSNAIDGGVGWKTSNDNEFHIYADYLLHFNHLIEAKKGDLPVYVGGGLRWVKRDKGDNKFGVRIPFGLEYRFGGGALGAFAELVPVMNLKPDTDFDLEGGIGIRFYF